MGAKVGTPPPGRPATADGHWPASHARGLCPQVPRRSPPTHSPNGAKKTPCLEMGGGGEADARLAIGRSVRLVRLLVVVNHRVLPSSPLVGRVSGSSSARTRVGDRVPAQHQTVPAIRPHYLATVEYIYIHMGMRQQEREHAFTRVQRRYTTRDGGRPRAVRRRRKRGENGGAWGGAGERERGDETTRRPRV